MKKVIAILTLTSIFMACNNSQTQTEISADSATTASEPRDTTQIVVDEAKRLLDSPANKMDSAAIKLKEGSDKVQK